MLGTDPLSPIVTSFADGASKLEVNNNLANDERRRGPTPPCGYELQPNKL